MFTRGFTVPLFGLVAETDWALTKRTGSDIGGVVMGEIAPAIQY